MTKRLHTRWLALALGLGLGAVPFLGSADASPGPRSTANRAHATSSASHRRPAHRASGSRSALARATHSRSRDPEIPEDDLSLTREHVLATSASQSIGQAARGRLLNGITIQETEVVDVLANGTGTAFGTSELVAMLEHAAHDVAERHPGSVLALGDLSKRGGGRLGSHRSHRSGRDADVGFYFRDEQGNPYPARFFVRFDGRGHGVTGWSHANVVFDVERNWTLLESMIRYDGATLQYVFVTPALQALLIEEAQRRGVDEDTIERATSLMSHYAGGHDNHFHVRIHCPSNDAQCIDNEPARRRRGGRGRSHASHRGHAHTAHRAHARPARH